MSYENVIQMGGVSKAFPIYSKPHHRLLQMLAPGPKSRWFKEFKALHDVSISIGRGETVGIVGRNGSGKSTLLQLICGTLTPSSGTVEVHGRVAALLELGAGFNMDFTGRENVMLNGSILGLTRTEVERRFDAIAEFANIGEFMEQPVKTYSSGMYVRLAFAVAIHVNPDILIIDEALAVGDEAFQRKCFARIEAVRDAGATVLFVSHAASTVVDLCDRAILLDRGELLAVGAPKDIVSRYQRLLYAPEERVEALREELRSEFAGVRQRPALMDDTPYHAASPAPAGAAVPEDYLDPGLVPASVVVYENRGATIEDPHLKAADGRRVNVISQGKEYFYCYNVRVQREFDGVRCGMMIRTVTGIEIGGCVTSLPDEQLHADAGAMLKVRFRFRCLLAPGIYFLNAGVLARVGNEETFLDRRIDVAMFRVLHKEGRLATGSVDLEMEPVVCGV